MCETVVRQVELLSRESSQVAELPFGETVTHPIPMERHPFPGRHRVDEPAAGDPLRDRFDLGSTEAEAMSVPQERAAPYDGRVPG